MATLMALYALTMFSLEEPLPTLEDCYREMAAWRGFPPFQVDYVRQYASETANSADLQWEPTDPLRGRICIYRGWFRYTTFHRDIVFDPSEACLEVRWNGHRGIKVNPLTHSGVEFRAPNETLRQQWNQHLVLTCLQLDFTAQMHPAADDRQFFLPTALEQPGYQVKSWEMVDGVRCVRLALADQDQIWISPSLGWNVVRRRFRILNSASHRRLEIHPDSFLGLNGRYVPQQVRLRQEMEDGTVRHIRLDVLEYAIIPDEPFEPPRTPGSLWQYTNDQGAGVTEVIPGGSNLIVELTDRLKQRFHTDSEHRKSFREFVFPVIAGLVCAALVASVCRLWALVHRS